MEDDIFVSIVFVAKQTGGDIAYDEEEIMNVKWFSYDEILAMKSEIRNVDLMIGAINNTRTGVIAPLELVSIYSGVLK